MKSWNSILALYPSLGAYSLDLVFLLLANFGKDVGAPRYYVGLLSSYLDSQFHVLV
jgi:hypothetical protein